MKRACRIQELSQMGALLTLAAVLAFSPDAYLPMLARAFLLQWAILFGFLAVIFMWRRSWWSFHSAVFGAFLLIGQLPTSNFTTVPHGGGNSFRVMHMNVLQPNERFDAAISEAISGDPDVISVQEVGPEWAEALKAGLHGSYPFAHIEPRTNCYGIALFSKHPFKRVRTIEVGGSPFIDAVLDIHGAPFRLLSVHASSPVNYASFRRRNQQFKELATYLEGDQLPTVLVGDLNAVPWDRAFQRFCAKAELRSTSSLEQRTWPSIGPLAFIPLDHVLLSNGLLPISIRTIEVPGSDHRGLLAELELDHDAR